MAGASIPLNTLEQVPPPLPFPPLPPPLLSPSLLLPLEVPPPLIAARGSGGRFAPQRVRAEPGRQTVFGEFQAKNLASSSNDLHELRGKMH